MSNKSIKAAIKGSIANPEAANAVLDAIDVAIDLAEVTEDLSTLEETVEELTESSATVADLTALEESLGELAELNAATVVADIADPSTADAEDCANKINELLGSLRIAGILASA